MGQVNDLKDFTRGQLDAALMKIGQDVGMGTKEGIEAFLRGELAVKVVGLLRQLTTVSVVGTEKFVATEHLAQANIGWMSENFREFFSGTVEEGVKNATIAVHNLARASLDAPIMAGLGDRVEIHLCQFFALIAKQSKGEAGPLLVNGYANIAYIKGNDGNFWAVDARWDSVYGCWRVDAGSVGDPCEWSAGSRVLSRDSDSL